MDARVVAEPVVMGMTAGPNVTVTTVIVVDDLVIALESLFDAATTLAPLLSQGSHSISAVAPNTFHEREVSVQAVSV